MSKVCPKWLLVSKLQYINIKYNWEKAPKIYLLKITAKLQMLDAYSSFLMPKTLCI